MPALRKADDPRGVRLRRASPTRQSGVEGTVRAAPRRRAIPQELLWRTRLPPAHTPRGARTDGVRPNHRGAVRPGARPPRAPLAPRQPGRRRRKTMRRNGQMGGGGRYGRAPGRCARSAHRAGATAFDEATPAFGGKRCVAVRHAQISLPATAVDRRGSRPGPAGLKAEASRTGPSAAAARAGQGHRVIGVAPVAVMDRSHSRAAAPGSMAYARTPPSSMRASWAEIRETSQSSR